MNRTKFVAGSIYGPLSLDRAQSGSRRRFYPLNRRNLVWLAVMISCLVCGMLVGTVFAGVTASISGTVKDASGATMAGAKVRAINTETHISQIQQTNIQGYYSFQSLPLGHYTLEVEQSGFKIFRQTAVVLDVNAALVIDVTLQVGAVKELVEVQSNAVHVETASSQMGEVIEGDRITTVPLVTRSYTDLLALQPGVISSASGMTGGYAGTFNSAGFAVPLVSGSLNSGALSVNGQREAENGFLLNGLIVQEFGYGGAAAIPNLDSLAEFRILTNNYDAEYGNYSGGQINVITKSGANSLHGNVFEFVRNTSLDARNYFDPVGQIGAYHKNEFGGTIGGPIKRDKLFFFADYTGDRIVQGVSSQNIGVPTQAEQGGDFSAVSSNITGLVTGSVWAQHLSSLLNHTVNVGDPYFTPGCTTSTQCVFPNAQVPKSLFSPISLNILPSIPTPNNPNGFSTNSDPLSISDNKTSGRVDANLGIGLLSTYYYFDNYTLTTPYPTANIPGFEAAGTGRVQVITIGDTKTLGTSAVNEARIGFVRNNHRLNKPQGGTGKSLSSLGFTTGGLGIVPINPSIEGIPEIDFTGSGLTIGVPSRPNHLIENTFQALDNFSKVVSTHTIKFGGNFHYNQLVEQLSNVVNGNFVFTGNETGIDFLDFLIGAPTNYVQGQATPSNGRARYFGLYAQDSWRARSNLTLNYGLRWDVSTPWWEQHNQIETIVPGLQSRVFPGSPRGWVFPGDPGIPRTLAPTRYNNFGPRFGLTYSPSADSGILGKLTGGPGRTSIRAGWGLFYTAFEGATNFNEIGDAPFGFFYVGTEPNFATPFVNRTDGTQLVQKFPVAFPPLNVGPNNPDNNVDWTKLTPIGSSPGFYNKNRLPYTENYELSLQRQLSNSTVLTLSYVGSQAHRLLSTMESNPVNPQLCLATPGCRPGNENNFDVRLPIFGPLFNTNGYFITNGQSSYNSLQLNLKHSTKSLSILAGYTYSKSLDNASGYGEQVNPFVPKATMALSAFDATHNFVVSYAYALPFDKLGGPRLLTHGWQLSGITRFSTGLPVTLIESDDNSLLGTYFTGPIPLPIDTPNVTGAPLSLGDPRNGPYFNPAAFAPETIGQLGNARRRFFHGPGINNWDTALLKDTRFTERLDLQFRAEFFNLFNHAQFTNVQGNINAGAGFGKAQTANPPRIGQLSLKLNF
jgi:Carboxypeptidase regulatory-like domain